MIYIAFDGVQSADVQQYYTTGIPMDNFSVSEIKDIRTGQKNHIVEFKNGYLYSIPQGKEEEFVAKLTLKAMDRKGEKYQKNLAFLCYYLDV